MCFSLRMTRRGGKLSSEETGGSIDSAGRKAWRESADCGKRLWCYNPDKHVLMPFRLLLIPLLLLVPMRAFSAELELRYSALERLIGEQLFSQDGKRYVRGSAKAKCQYAYLEAPKLDAERPVSEKSVPANPVLEKTGDDLERLRIAARFSGRSAIDVMGRCVGLGDSFDLKLTAVPVARDGAIELSSVKVSTLRDSYYIRRVRSALEQSFAHGFRIEIKDQARKLLEMPAANGSYRPELTGFTLNGVRVTDDALVLSVDFRLIVQ